MKHSDVVELLKETGRTWYRHESYRLGAALAYYAAVSMAPVLIIAVALASLVFGKQAVRGQLVVQIESTVGPRMARTIQEILSQTHTASSGLLTTAVSVAVVLISATAVFAELQNALDTIWDVQPKTGRGWLGVVKDRFWSFILVLAIGSLLLAPLAASTGLNMIWPSAQLSTSSSWWQPVEFVVSLGLLMLFFAMIYKVLPDVVITWWDVWVGAAVTAILFTFGKYVIGLYLRHVSVSSAYGGAGSLAVILVWVYYSSQILLLGAVFTQVYANKFGRPMVRADKAMPHRREGPGKKNVTDSHHADWSQR